VAWSPTNRPRLAAYTVATGWGTSDYGIGSAELGTDWHHTRLAYDHSEGDGLYFLDGVHVGTDSSVTGPPFGNTGHDKCSIGRDSTFSGTDLSGQLCGLAIVANKALSTAKFTPPTLSEMMMGNSLDVPHSTSDAID
jgi:hypothetical protein